MFKFRKDIQGVQSQVIILSGYVGHRYFFADEQTAIGADIILVANTRKE
jgi:hypothetical protein